MAEGGITLILMNTQPWDVIIIGGGAAGLSAALMLGRSRRRTLVIDTGSPRNRFASHMHGVLGNEGASPADLVERGRAEAAGYGVEFLADAVERVDQTDDGVLVKLREGDPLRARALIVASGLVDDLPDIPGLAERWGKSVLHCPYCHGWEVRGQRLGILATSPLGLHHAQLVRQWTDDLTVFTADIGPMDDATIHRLRSRGIRLIASPVTEVLGEGDQVTGVRTSDGNVTELDAIFTAATLRPRDEFLRHLDLDRADTPMGSFLAADPMGQTSSSRIWAVGNVTSPGGNVPMSIGAGASAGAMVNMALVTEDFDRAVAIADAAPDMAPADYWEQRYAGPDHMWSGRVNKVLSDVAADLTRDARSISDAARVATQSGSPRTVGSRRVSTSPPPPSAAPAPLHTPRASQMTASRSRRATCRRSTTPRHTTWSPRASCTLPSSSRAATSCVPRPT